MGSSCFGEQLPKNFCISEVSSFFCLNLVLVEEQMRMDM